MRGACKVRQVPGGAQVGVQGALEVSEGHQRDAQGTSKGHSRCAKGMQGTLQVCKGHFRDI